MPRPAFVLACALAVAGCASTAPGPVAPDSLPIGAVQGRGIRSPLEGREVTVTGVVTALLDEGHGGWFVQDGGDDDAATSDGLLVTAAQGEPPAVGQRLQIHGRVVERAAGKDATITSLEASRVTRLGQASPVAATVLRTPPADWEPFEGMRLRVAGPLTVSGTGALERHGELAASFDGRLFTPTELARPGAAAQRLAADNARRTLLLDDGSTAQNPGAAWYLPPPIPRTGSLVDEVTGVLDVRLDAWRLQLDAPLQPRLAARPPPPRVGGDLRIASFNLENLFNGDGRGGGFPTLRGARTEAEWRAQRAKLVATIQALDPDIAALMELENDGFGPESTIAQLVAALGNEWRFVDAGQGPGTDEIRVGLLYRATRVAPVGKAATRTTGPFGRRSRAPLAQAFAPVGAGKAPVFVVAANHFKSKGCAEATGADADQHDGQACWNALRTESARQLDTWLHGDPTRSGSDMTVIVGDLNAYAQEDPVQALVGAGWVDALVAAQVDAPYSYVYDGQSGRLDHALLSPALARHLVGAAEWHVNADEPASSGYRAGGPGPWGGSDHDPLVLGFRLRGAHPR